MKPCLVPITRICKWTPCSQPFTITPIRTRDTLREFCSTSCRAKHAKSNQVPSTLADRFWAKVLKGSPDDCWLWQGAKAGKGYGTIYVLEQDRLIGAHVVSWFLHTGEWPPPDQDVLHNCPGGDRTDCVNFPHLWLGTHQDNMLDKVAKGRDLNQYASVTQATREEIVARYMTGHWSYDALARQYGLSSQSIYTYVRKHRESLNT